MNRLIEKMVFFGLVIACRFAGSPTFRSPFSVNATIDGVVLLPSLFGITTGSFPSITATHEFVVPRSMPIIFPIVCFVYVLIFLFGSVKFILPVNDCAKYRQTGNP
jgi:hypothetical protein